MRHILSLVSILTGCVILSACGQSGELQLPSDPHLDKRAKYLLYKNESDRANATSDVQSTDQQPATSVIPPASSTAP